MNVSLSKLWQIVKDREAWHAAVHGVTKSWTWLSHWTKDMINILIMMIDRYYDDSWLPSCSPPVLEKLWYTLWASLAPSPCSVYRSLWSPQGHRSELTSSLFPTACCSSTGISKCSVQFNCSVVYDSLQLHGLQHTRLPVHRQLLEFTQTHVHWVSDAIQPSNTLSSPSPPVFNLSQHQGLFQCVSYSHQVAKVLEFWLQYQSFQWTVRIDFL